MDKIIEIIKYFLIGIIQGISEILPISSSGHLAISYYFLNIGDKHQMNLTIFLHFASSIALCIYFKDIIKKMIIGFLGYIFKKEDKYKDDFKLSLFLIASTIPSIIVAFFIKPFVDDSFNNIILICINLMITSFILFLSNKIKNNKENNYTFKNTLITGIFQCFALFPGISRSGITLLGSKIAKLNDNKGKEFTFLLLVPISLGSFILSIFDFDIFLLKSSEIYLYLISFFVTLIFTYLSLKILFNKALKIKYYHYSIYLLIISIITIICYKNT